MSEPSDLDLVDRFRRLNEPAAFDRLVERHQGWVRRVCARILRSDQLAQDASQEVFARALAHIGDWRGHNFPGWLKAIAVNCSLTIVEREKRWAPLEQAPNVTAPTPDPEQDLAASQRAARIRAVIARLPDKQRVVFVMKYIDGLSYQDIARLTGFSDKEVKSFVQNARRNFSIGWAKTGDEQP